MKNGREVVNLTGQRFGRMIVVGVYYDSEKSRWQSKCLCDCGKVKFVRGADLKNGKVKSCGCLKDEQTAERNRENATRDGLTHSPTGISWGAMITRCYNKNVHCYPHYGGRGITVCEYLRASPLNLVLMIGPRPDRQSIERIDTNAHYSCGACAECKSNGWAKNVKWATQKEQTRNQRRNHFIEINGEKKCLVEWSETSGLKAGTILTRLRRKWPAEKLLNPLTR